MPLEKKQKNKKKSCCGKLQSGAHELDMLLAQPDHRSSHNEESGWLFREMNVRPELPTKLALMSGPAGSFFYLTHFERLAAFVRRSSQEAGFHYETYLLTALVGG